MKPVQRPFFYEKYLHLMKGEDSNAHFEAISSELDEVIEETKLIGFGEKYATLVLMVLLPLLLLTLAFYIKESWSYKLLPGVLAIIFMIYKRSQLGDLIKSLKKPAKGDDVREYVRAKFVYAKKGLKTKFFKISFLQQLFIGFFPWIMFLLAELLFGSFTSYEALVGLVLAYILSSILWYKIFDQELNPIEPLTTSIKEMEAIFYQH